MARTAIISPNPASRVWRGRCARRSRSIRVPRAKCHPPRVSSAADVWFSGGERRCRSIQFMLRLTGSGSPCDRQVHLRARWLSFLGLCSGRGVAGLASPVAGADRLDRRDRRARFRNDGVGPGTIAVFLANVLLSLLLGFEAASLQRWTLSRRNWRQLDIVVADDEESAERRFFDRWTAKSRGSAFDHSAVDRGGPPPTRDVPGQPFSRPPPLPQNAIIGLFPEPGASR